MNLRKYFERLGEKVKKNNQEKKREIAIATRLDSIHGTLLNQSVNTVNSITNDSNNCIWAPKKNDGFEL